MANRSILPVAQQDRTILGEFLFYSKLNLVINHLLFKDWPNEAAQISNYQKAIDSSFEDPEAECLKVEESGEIVGFLVLTRKKPVKPELLENGKENKSIPEAFNPDIFTSVTKAAAEINQDMKRVDHFEITYICVQTSSRRQGIGSQLIQECFARAKVEGIPLVISSEPAAYEFFLKLGFKDTNHVDFDLTQWAPPNSGFGIFRLAGMIWSP